MKDRKPRCTALKMSKRGRPQVTDRTKIKGCSMTVCLLPETKSALMRLASKNSQKTAAMARILIELGLSK